MASASSEYSQRIEVPIRERKITEDGPVYGLVVCWASMPSSTSGAARPVSYLCEFNVTYCTSGSRVPTATCSDWNYVRFPTCRHFQINMASLRFVCGRSSSLLAARCVTFRFAKTLSAASGSESTDVVTHTGQVC